MLYSSQGNPYLDDPDVQLMLAFQKGDKTSFETLMTKFYPRVLNFIYRYTGSRETAEDLTQEVFIKVYKSAANYRPESKFQTWLYTIARNASLNEVRRAKQPTVSLDAPVGGDKKDMPRQLADVRAGTADQKMIDKERTDMIKQAIQDLPENQRLAVILRRYENFSYEDIARTMNLSMEAVKSLLNRAKESLKVKLKRLIKD